MPQVKRYCPYGPAYRIDEMAARQIKRVTAAIDERLSFTVLQGLHDDLRLIPRIGQPGISSARLKATTPDREKDTLAAGKYLRSRYGLVVLDSHETFWFASVR